MLYFKTLDPNTFSLLKRLQALPVLNNFYLVGGTALALQFGHRLSIDLDLFCNEEFDRNNIIQALEMEFGDEFEYEGKSANPGIFCFIQNVKTDMVYYPHSVIFPVVSSAEIRMYGSEEIAAMKIQAVLGRGKKNFLGYSRIA